MAKRITEEEIRRLYVRFQTPPHVIGHCREVARVATGLAEALNQHGFSFDLRLIQGAALVHDVARTQDEHWNVAADALEAMGYRDEADIVRVHMYYSFHPIDALNEADMVCLGDRLVKEDHYVGLDERISYILHKAPNKPEIQKNILKNKEATGKLLRQIEEKIGTTLDEMFSGEMRL